MIMRILITGITGFAGSYLAEALLTDKSVELHGTSRDQEWPASCAHLAERVKFRTCDLCDGAAVMAVLRESQPDQIYHLAGFAHAGQSFQDPDAAWEGNLTATRRLYDAIARWGGSPRVLFVGSGLIYGDISGPDNPPDEDTPLHPNSPYASSKAAADLVSYQYTVAPGLDIVRVRPFNHIGPRQGPQFAVAHFAQQIAVIERGACPPVLETGDLRPRRDLTDVRDMVRAYLLLMERGRTGRAYNAGTGTSQSMQEVLERLLAQARVKIDTRQQAELMRVAETNVVRANATRLRKEIGWLPQIPLQQTLIDILEYWRQQS
jgi:GDP-4-dehydro-6-deoxy-D-mannose reductase